MLQDRDYRWVPALEFEEDGPTDVDSSETESETEDKPKPKPKKAKGPFKKHVRMKMEALLRSLTSTRESVGRAMAHALENAEWSDEVLPNDLCNYTADASADLRHGHRVNASAHHTYTSQDCSTLSLFRHPCELIKYAAIRMEIPLRLRREALARFRTSQRGLFILSRSNEGGRIQAADHERAQPLGIAFGVHSFR